MKRVSVSGNSARARSAHGPADVIGAGIAQGWPAPSGGRRCLSLQEARPLGGPPGPREEMISARAALDVGAKAVSVPCWRRSLPERGSNPEVAATAGARSASLNTMISASTDSRIGVNADARPGRRA